MITICRKQNITRLAADFIELLNYIQYLDCSNAGGWKFPAVCCAFEKNTELRCEAFKIEKMNEKQK